MGSIIRADASNDQDVGDISKVSVSNCQDAGNTSGANIGANILLKYEII